MDDASDDPLFLVEAFPPLPWYITLGGKNVSEIDVAATWHLIRTAGACIAIFGAGLLGTAIVVHVGDWWYRRKYGDSPQD